MKLRKYIIAAALVVAATLPATAQSSKDAVERVYMFGLAASFNDTIVHFTEIQPIDSAWLSKKNKFLMGREQYSNQLRDFLAQQQQMPARTCIVFYDRKLGRLQKKYLKMKKLYTTGKKGEKTRNDIRTLMAGEFSFKNVNMNPTSTE